MGIFILFYVYAHTGFKLKTEGSSCQRYKMALFHYKKSIKGTSDLTNPYVHSIFVLLLTKQIFETNHWGQRLKARHSFGLELSLLHMWMPDCSLPIWNMFLNLLMMVVKSGVPAQMMASTNRIMILRISIWLRKINSPWSNCDGLAPSLQVLL